MHSAPHTPQELLGIVQGPAIAVMLYGSYARGDWSPQSDVDVLQLVSERGEHYAVGPVSVSVYSVDQLRRMCRAGSLFALHLRTEGRILIDPENVLTRVLAEYRPPDSYVPLWKEMEAAAELLVTRSPATDAQPEGLVRLALYLVRNTAIIRHIERFGIACFSIPELARRLRLDDLKAAFANREDAARLDKARLILAKRVLELLLGHRIQSDHGSLEAAAVNLEVDHPVASALALHLLAGERTLAYGDVFLDPLVAVRE